MTHGNGGVLGSLPALPLVGGKMHVGTGMRGSNWALKVLHAARGRTAWHYYGDTSHPPDSFLPCSLKFWQCVDAW